MYPVEVQIVLGRFRRHVAHLVYRYSAVESGATVMEMHS